MATFSIGELARRANVGVETVRFYERQGLFKAPQRKASGYRQFDETTVLTLKFIRNAQDVGFTLKEIKDLLILKSDPAATRTEVRQQVRIKVQALEGQIEELQRMRNSLKSLLEQCCGNGSLEGCPILAGLQESSSN